MNILVIFFVVVIGLGVIYYLFNSLIHPYLAIFLVAIGSYFGYMLQLVKGGPIAFTWFQIFLFLAFVVFILHKLVKQDFKLITTSIDIEFLLLFLLIFFSLIYSPNRGDGLFYATRFLVLIVMVYLILNSVDNVKQIQFIIYGLILVSIFLGINSIKEALLNPQAVMWNYLTMGNKFLSRGTDLIIHDPNIFATHFFLPISFVSAVVLEKSQKLIIRIIGVLLLVILIFSVISTFSRSAWVSLFFLLLILIFLFRQFKPLIFLLLAVIVAILVIPYFQMLITNIVNRFLDIFAGTSDYSSRVRVFLGIGGIEMFLDSHLLGVGFRAFKVVFPGYISPELTGGVTGPHNITYTILAELGLLGFLLYVWILYKIGNIAFINFKRSNSVNTKIISASLFSTFLCYIIFYQFYGGGLFDNNFWFIVGLIFSIHSIMDSKVDNHVSTPQKT